MPMLLYRKKCPINGTISEDTVPKSYKKAHNQRYVRRSGYVPYVVGYSVRVPVT